MFIKRLVKGFIYLVIGFLLVYFLEDPLISLSVGVVIIIVLEIIDGMMEKFGGKADK